MSAPGDGTGPAHAVTVMPLHGIPEVREGDDLAALLLAATQRAGLHLTDGDVLAVSSKIASKAMGLVAPLAQRDAVIDTETVSIVAERALPGGRVTRIVHAAAGPVMAAAGVDASNTGGREIVLLLPRDPDAVCRALHARLVAATGVTRLGVLLTDTAGRPWRIGQTDFALGSHGLAVVEDLRGGTDADGRALLVTTRVVADEVAAAADLVKGKTSAVPAALLRGLGEHVLGPAEAATAPGARSLVRPPEEDWFAFGSHEAVVAALGVPPGSGLNAATPLRPAGHGIEAAEARIRRAIGPAFLPQLDPWQAGVELHVPERGDWIEFTGGDPFAVGLVTARVLVALAGEGVPHRIASQETTAGQCRVRLVPRSVD
jgi:coenzyme F420-0:L-glutamate ligase/coenzyme F420-1:gamma-L-glutamate ligase